MATTAAALLDARPVKPGTRRAAVELRRLRRECLRDMRPSLKALRDAALACARIKRGMRLRAAALLARGVERPRSLDVDRHGTLEEQRFAHEWPRRAALEDIAEAAAHYLRAADRAAASVGAAPRLPDEPAANATDDELTDAEGTDDEAAFKAWDDAIAAEHARAPGACFDSSEDEEGEAAGAAAWDAAIAEGRVDGVCFKPQ